MIKAGIIGAAGYTGQELTGILLRHPQVDLTLITSGANQGKSLAEVFPQYARQKPLVFEGHDLDAAARRCEAVFLCLPHRESMAAASKLLDAGKVVFDLSADFRLKDAAVYEKWYGAAHTAPRHLAQAVYGSPELYRGRLQNAGLVAVPGCYPTSVILALAPVMGTGLIDESTIVANSASGVTGAGRKLEQPYLLAELEGNMFAYGAPSHRHTPEIEQELSNLAGAPVTITFIPHLLPVARGIYTTVTAKLQKPSAREEILETYRAYYRDSRFVTVTPGYPHMRWAVGNNGAYLGVEVDARTGTFIATAAIDNLVKGASGQAAQCFNIRYGFDEGTGLE
ncbi:MAG: N-acetyl-gamma-glutamyl-phosphate reductase [Nitrospinae bacterium]|nr:N-acetyl-gamma-glutamyl-phosphate reductase [Nitrospinota bacterium]